MLDTNEVVLSSRDAAVLSAVVSDWPARDAAEQAAADALADALGAARLLPGRTPAPNVVALGATVTYDEWPLGTRRTITLVHPARADASHALVSVFAPVARALVGRRAGARVPAQLPDRGIRELRVVSVERSDGAPTS